MTEASTDAMAPAADEAPAGAQRQVTFHSKFPDPVICVKTPWMRRNLENIIIERDPGIHVEFRNYQAVVSEEVADLLRQKTLDDGSAMVYGKDFWEQTNVPGQLYPRVVDLTEEITMAAARQDRGAIGAILEDERATHQRPEVVNHAMAALRTLEEVK